MPKLLSKSNYINFLKHPAWLWLDKHQRTDLPDHDEGLLKIFEMGNEFEEYVEQLYPNAVKLEFERGSYESYLQLELETTEQIKSGAQTIMQGRVQANRLTCIFDILERVDGNTFDLTEVKSGTSVKDYYFHDLAFQKIVMEKAGYNIRNIYVIYVNNDYVRDGDIDIQKLSKKEDVTDGVNEVIDFTKEQIEEALNVIDSDEMPDLSPRHANKFDIEYDWFGYWYDVFMHLNPDLDPESMYHLYGPNAAQIGNLEDGGHEFIRDIPEEYSEKDKQTYQIKASKEGKRLINVERLKEFIDSFEYPLYFLDYETFSEVIPPFDGLSPYKQYPFQYSLHILREPGGELEHREYLHKENSNPMPDLLKQLEKDIGDSGTVLTWYMNFEKGCNNRMAEVVPEYADFMEDLNERINDLMLPFSEFWFVDKDFYGSASLKYVLPVLAPELSYSDLDVSDGGHAQRAWTNTVLKEKDDYDKDEVFPKLLEYCELDTFAMVRILEELEKEIQ